MIPFIDLGPIELGSIKLHLFGILVATGVVVGSWVGARYSEKNEIDVDWLRWAVFRAIIGGFIIAHMFDVIAYQPSALADDPALLFKLWAGFSSLWRISRRPDHVLVGHLETLRATCLAA